MGGSYPSRECDPGCNGDSDFVGVSKCVAWGENNMLKLSGAWVYPLKVRWGGSRSTDVQWGVGVSLLSCRKEEEGRGHAEQQEIPRSAAWPGQFLHGLQEGGRHKKRADSGSADSLM